MATISLHKERLNSVGGLIDSMIRSSGSLDSQMGTLRNTLQGVDSSTCNLQGVIDSISSSSKSEKAKSDSLNRLKNKVNDFISMAARKDAQAKSEIERAKKDFYSKYSYLKPECERSTLEHIRDGLKSAGEWCKEHWKLIVVAIIVIVSIVVLLIPGIGPIIAGACWGALLGACLGGVSGGLESMANGGSFLEGFEDGALTGAITGAISGAAMAGLGVLGGSLGKFVSCGSTIGKFVKGTAAVTKVMSTAMGGFDMVAMADKYFGNGDIAALNAKLHESNAYNIFQTGVGVTAAFTGGMTTTMKCFVAGTLIYTTGGLVAIENIKAGDMVIATDPETGETSPKSVLETYIRKTSHLVHLTVCDETVVSTFDHPYFVNGKGFVSACDLWIGAELIDSSGSVRVVEQLYREDLSEEEVTVYNFKVEEYHTYYVGESNLLVHNANYPEHMNADGSLKPDSEYTTGEYDYKYKTDSQGRIKNVHADELHMKGHSGRLPHSANTPDKLSGDHAGHIIADQFGGSPKLDNIVSQNGGLNTHEYRNMERSWSNAINNGQKVTDVNVKLNYPSGSSRPSSYNVTYKIDGIKHKHIFINKK